MWIINRVAAEGKAGLEAVLGWSQPVFAVQFYRQQVQCPPAARGQQGVSTSDCSVVSRGSTASSVRWWLSLAPRSVRPVSPLSRVQHSSSMPSNILRINIQRKPCSFSVKACFSAP
jgi:hypothetical protein